jgi:hypothetical protein
MATFVVIAADVRNAANEPTTKEFVLEVIHASNVEIAERYIMGNYDLEGAGELFKSGPISLYTDCIVSTHYSEGKFIDQIYENEEVVEKDSKYYTVKIVRIPDDPKHVTILNESNAVHNAASNATNTESATRPMVGGRRRKTHHRRRHSHRRRSHRR